MLKDIEKHIDFNYEISVDAQFIIKDNFFTDTAIFESVNEYIECKSLQEYVRFAGEVEDYVSFFGELAPKTEGNFKMDDVSKTEQIYLYLNGLKSESKDEYAVFR